MQTLMKFTQACSKLGVKGEEIFEEVNQNFDDSVIESVSTCIIKDAKHKLNGSGELELLQLMKENK